MNPWVIKILCFIGIHTPAVFDRQDQYYRMRCDSCHKVDKIKYNYVDEDEEYENEIKQTQ